MPRYTTFCDCGRSCQRRPCWRCTMNSGRAGHRLPKDRAVVQVTDDLGTSSAAWLWSHGLRIQAHAARVAVELADADARERRHTERADDPEMGRRAVERRKRRERSA